MISYKVLITVTVIYIISCSGSVEECEEKLQEIGFSNSSFMSYCFARQFPGILQFKSLVIRNQDPILSEFEVEFFSTFRNKFKKGEDKLKTPKEYCEGLTNYFIVQPSKSTKYVIVHILYYIQFICKL
ncbi:uncharacterized protein LOC107884241 isoform X1 [Acyrthosiphon pisum]|uniref:Uncharacterized protein n=1 Tax=Acyrthosiphon pisum TaxID=7029 RepID=A0A8R2JQM6_ACYPI|nr:uncharacterized protein LOC107884241 isoform X1 [Acyrthosiphon pisum]